MVSSQDKADIQAYLKSKLEDFTGSLQYSKDILEILGTEKKYQSFTDEVNSSLVQKFECLEDYKLITLISAYDPALKSGGQTNSAVWDTTGDLMIQCDHTWQHFNFSLCLHLVLIPEEDE